MGPMSRNATSSHPAARWRWRSQRGRPPSRGASGWPDAPRRPVKRRRQPARLTRTCRLAHG